MLVPRRLLGNDDDDDDGDHDDDNCASRSSCRHRRSCSHGSCHSGRSSCRRRCSRREHITLRSTRTYSLRSCRHTLRSTSMLLTQQPWSAEWWVALLLSEAGSFCTSCARRCYTSRLLIHTSSSPSSSSHIIISDHRHLHVSSTISINHQHYHPAGCQQWCSLSSLPPWSPLLSSPLSLLSSPCCCRCRRRRRRRHD